MGERLLLLLALLSASPPPTLPAGITAHTEVGRRALDLYGSSRLGGAIPGILAERQDAFQAGAPFPDFFYNPLCGDFHDVAEDAHWGPYLKVAVDYFRQEYQGSDLDSDQDARALLAFIFGIATHQSADTSWHGLEGLEEGLLPMLAAVDFEGDWDQAHTVLDTGGDIAGAYLWDTDYADEWYIPSQDLYNILVLYNDGEDFGLTPEDFESCGAWMHLLRGAEQLEIAAILYPPVAETSPTMIDELENYMSGGMGDMVAWTRLTWDTVATMMEEGTEDCDITDNPMTIQCQGSPERSARIATRRTTLDHSGVPIYQFSTISDVAITRTEKGAFIRMAESEEQGGRHQREGGGLSRAGKKTSEKGRMSVSASLYSSRPYAELGAALATGSAGDRLVIGAPGYMREDGVHLQGCVFLVDRVQDVAGEVPVEEVASQMLCDEERAYSRFGHAVSLADVDGDGVEDLLVGAPNAGSDNLTYSGGLLIYYGSPDGLFSSAPDLNLTMGGEDEYAAFGWAIERASNQTSIRVGARHFLGGGTEQAGLVDDLLGDELFPFGEGPSPFSWFGHALATFQGPDLEPLWAVGEPGSGAGKVAILDEAGDFIVELVGTEDREKLGFSLAAGGAMVNGTEINVLLVGAPVSNSSNGDDLSHSGAVYVYDVDNLQAGQPIAKLEGQVSNGRFGFSLLLLDSGSLLVGSPRYAGTFGKERGAVILLDDLGEVDGDDDILEGEEELTFFAGGGMVQMRNSFVAVGAPHDGSFGERRGGSVKIVRLD